MGESGKFFPQFYQKCPYCILWVEEKERLVYYLKSASQPVNTQRSQRMCSKTLLISVVCVQPKNSGVGTGQGFTLFSLFHWFLKKHSSCPLSSVSTNSISFVPPGPLAVREGLLISFGGKNSLRQFPSGVPTQSPLSPRWSYILLQF